MDAATAVHTYTLLLHSTVPSSRHTQLLHILTGVCGHPPVSVLERHLIFKPTTQSARAIAADEGGGTQNVVDREKARRRAEREARETGKSNAIVRYVEEVQMEGFEALENVAEGVAMDVDEVRRKSETNWSCRVYDVPDPNVRAVTARRCERVDVSEDVKSADVAVKEAEGKGLRFVSQYIIIGSQFVHSNIILLLHKPLLPPSPQDPTAPLDVTNVGAIKDMKPLDPSDAYILKARLEILDAPGAPPSNDLISQGMKEMGRFKELMKGCVDLKTVERMSLNTKVA